MQFYVMTRTHVRQFTLVHVAKYHSKMLFSHNWFQGNSMCIDREQLTQLCPYQMESMLHETLSRVLYVTAKASAYSNCV